MAIQNLFFLVYLIPYSQFLRLRPRSDDSDFSKKSEEMCQFFEKRGYPTSVVQMGHHRAQQIDRQSALQTSQKEKKETIEFHSHSHSIITITRLNPSFSKTSSCFKMIPKLVKSFRNLHSFHSNATKI